MPKRPLPRAPQGSPPVVVVGLDCITGLQSARILADRGVSVTGVVADRRHWGARTNACVDVVESPLSGEGLVSCLLNLGGPAPAVLLPCTDASVATISAARDRLAGAFTVALGPHAAVELLMDKVRFAEYAATQGLPVPRTVVLTDRGEVEAAATALDYPCVLKPPMKSQTWLAHTTAKAFTVRDADELLSTYDRVAGWSPVLLAQEWVEGPEDGLFSCNACFAEGGRALATFVARKVRQWPPQIGTSASGEECRNDEVLDTTVRLFGGLGYRGLAYLEMKRDARTGRLMIIEPNVGRPTGRSAIAEAGGVELLYTAYCDAAGLPLPEARRQRYVGVKWLDLRRDVQAVAVGSRNGSVTVGEWLRWLRGPKAHAIWSGRDPSPFLTDTAQALGTGSRRLFARAMGRASVPKGRTRDLPTAGAAILGGPHPIHRTIQGR